MRTDLNNRVTLFVFGRDHRPKTRLPRIFASSVEFDVIFRKIFFCVMSSLEPFLRRREPVSVLLNKMDNFRSHHFTSPVYIYMPLGFREWVQMLRTEGHTDSHEKPKMFRLDGLQFFHSYGAPLELLCRTGAPLLVV